MMRVRYYGHVGSTSGYGRAAADMCMALLSTGRVELEIEAIDYRPDQARVALAGRREALVPLIRRPGHQRSQPDAIILHTLPLDIPLAWQMILTTDTELELTRRVAVTTWEGQTATSAVLAGYEGFDQLWMPSRSSLNAFKDADTVRRLPECHVMPHAFDTSTVVEREQRINDGIYRFYYIGSWNSRKNPAGLLRAWALAFTAQDRNVSLTLHCPGASTEQFLVALHQTGLSPSDMAPVVFSNKPIPESEIWNMHSQYDCFVTASRGEAWNLPAFDAMLAGRFVISPRRLGSDDYLEETDAALIPGIKMPATVDIRVTGSSATGMDMQKVSAQGMSSRSLWIEPDLTTLATIMRYRAADRLRNMAVGYDVTRYSYSAVGQMALRALENL